jgi:hypothetical protein
VIEQFDKETGKVAVEKTAFGRSCTSGNSVQNMYPLLREDLPRLTVQGSS